MQAGASLGRYTSGGFPLFCVRFVHNVHKALMNEIMFSISRRRIEIEYYIELNLRD